VKMPARYRLIAMTFALSMLLLIDRIALSTAKGPLTSELGLIDTQFGWVVSAFALGYALFQTPGGLVADRLGPRIVLTGLALLWSLFTALIGSAWSFTSLLVFNFLFGAAEAGAIPTINRAFYDWLPAAERGRAQGITFSGARLGPAFGMVLLPWIVTQFGWRQTFEILGGAGAIWAVAWWLWFRDRPEEHAGVSTDERAFILKGRQTPGRATVGPAPGARDLIRSSSLWFIMSQYFATQFTFFFCISWLFPYLQRTYNLGAVQAGLFASAPLFAGALGNWTSGIIVDRLYKRGRWRQSRQGPAIAGFLLAAAGLLASLLFANPVLAVACLAVAIFGADMTLPPSWSFCIDIGREHAGVVSGTMNGAGSLGAFLTSLAFPYLLLMTGSTTPFFVVGATLNLLAAGLWTRARPERAIVVLDARTAVAR